MSADVAAYMRWASDRRGKTTFVSPDWTAFTGQTSEGAIGDGWLSVVHPRDALFLRHFLRAAHMAGTSYELRYRISDLRGRYHWVADRASYRLGSSRVVEGFEGTIEVVGPDDSAPIHAFGSIGAPSKMFDIADHLLVARRLAIGLGDADMLASIDISLSAVGHKLGQAGSCQATNDPC